MSLSLMQLAQYAPYLPTFLYSISLQALFLLLPLYLVESGFSSSLAAMIIGLRGVGLLITDIPSGYFSDRYGNYAGLVFGSGLFVFAYGLIALGGRPTPMIIGGLILGVGLSLSQIGRQGFIAFQMPQFSTGKKLSLLGSAVRFGALIGPPLAALVADLAGYELAFRVLTLVTAASFCVELYILNKSNIRDQKKTSNSTLTPAELLEYLMKVRRHFLGSSVFIFFLQSLRTSKIALIPLVGSAHGFSISSVGWAVAIGTLADSFLSVKAGSLMDRFGRRWSALPSLAGISIGFVLLGMAENYGVYLLAVFMLGAFDGISAGLVLVLAADLAPQDKGKSQYLALIKLISDSAMAASPLAISYFLLFTDLSLMTVINGIIGIFGFAAMVFLLKETRDFNKP